MQEGGRWVTINGRHVFVKNGQSPMDAFIRQEAKSEQQKQVEKEQLKQEANAKIEELNNFVKDNAIYGQYMTGSQAEKYVQLNKEIDDIKFKLETEYYSEISEKNIKDDRLTGLTKSVYVQARKDDLKNKDIYDAMSDAAHGTHFNADTRVDDILNGKNDKVTPQELYNTFSGTRKEIKKQYGDEITLYRVEGLQKSKATKNYGSSVEYTKQYGDDVKKYNIKVKDIVAIWTNRKGTYEDIIVATDGIEKYLKK